MGRYWRVYRAFFGSSLAREMEFRVNFFANVLVSAFWAVFALLILLVIFRNTNRIAGWSRGDALVLAGTVFLVDGIAGVFVRYVMEIPSQVRLGTLDFVVTKPIDAQFWVSLRRVNFGSLGMLLAGFAMLAAGLIERGASPGPLQWVGYLGLLLAALAVYYSFNLALMTTGIWLVRVENLWVLTETVLQVARYPIDIYGAGLVRFFTYAVPLAFLATIPSRQLVSGFDPGMVALGLAWAAAGLFLSRAFWRYALRHYTSASS